MFKVLILAVICNHYCQYIATTSKTATSYSPQTTLVASNWIPASTTWSSTCSTPTTCTTSFGGPFNTGLPDDVNQSNIDSDATQKRSSLAAQTVPEDQQRLQTRMPVVLAAMGQCQRLLLCLRAPKGQSSSSLGATSDMAMECLAGRRAPDSNQRAQEEHLTETKGTLPQGQQRQRQAVDQKGPVTLPTRRCFYLAVWSLLQRNILGSTLGQGHQVSYGCSGDRWGSGCSDSSRLSRHFASTSQHPLPIGKNGAPKECHHRIVSSPQGQGAGAEGHRTASGGQGSSQEAI